jgi:RHS repeat-associated protein
MTYHRSRLAFVSLSAAFVAAFMSYAISIAGQQNTAADPAKVVGQSATRLTDGRWLIAGGLRGDIPVREIAIVDTSGREVKAHVAVSLNDARGWHAATMLGDGRVLITGGVSSEGRVVDTAELFDPATGLVQLVPWFGTPRAHHTTTLLRNGLVLVAGGISRDQISLQTVEAFDPSTFEVRILDGGLLVPRQDHNATLLPDGSVKVEGGTSPGQDAAEAELYSVLAQRSRRLDGPEPQYQNATLVFASPVDGDQTDPRLPIVLQYTKPLAVQSLERAIIRLEDESGNQLGLRTVLAESGRLLHVVPENALVPGQTYRLSARDLYDTTGIWVANISLTFTVSPEDTAVALSEEEWAPNNTEKWRTDRERSPWTSLPPLRAAPGVTALSGQVLLLNGRPLAGVTLKLGNKSASTDNSGRFLITDVAAGQQTLVIDGRSASTQGRTFGVFVVATPIKEGDTTVLPYTAWMPRIDVAHAVSISSPTGADIVITTPRIPGLELHIPKGSIIRDHDGRVATTISITPIPVDRPPFPLPTGVDVPVYFTVQPGGGFIETRNTAWPSGARVVYPNFTSKRPGSKFQFWNYDPEERGWHVYGRGAVNASGGHVVPDPGVLVYRFTGTMINEWGGGQNPPPAGPVMGGARGGDPVDLGTGLFVLEKTDLYVADVVPLALTRTYRPNDSASRPFGIGASHPYRMFLWSAQQYQEADLVLADGARVHYVRISAGTGYTDAVFEHTATPGRFHKSQMVWHGHGFEVRLRDGTVFHFRSEAPLQWIRDRHGNTVNLTWSDTAVFGGGTGNILKVTSPHGRFIEFAYDASDRIIEATDNIGRTVGYEYDASGRLWKVTDAAGGVTEYTYDSSHRMLTIKDARGITYLTNQYDANGRVVLQTQANTTTYQFAYTLDGTGRVTQTDLTDPRGYVTRTNFNTSRYPTTQIEAYGTSAARTTTWTRHATTNAVTRVTDGLNRNTDFTYDSLGNVESVTRLAGTGGPVTTTYTYDPIVSELTSVTDPLSHTTTFTRNVTGDVTAITDPLSHQTNFTYNGEGQPLTVTTPAGTTSFSYELGDLTSVTDPLGRTTSRFLDTAGRLLGVTDPVGRTTRYEYDALNVTTKVSDALGGETTFTYDANRNLLTLTDARSNPTTYTYNNMDRVATRTDPLTRQESYTYDNNGNLSQITDRKSQVTAFAYDPLNRQTQAGYHDASTTDYTYDAGDRLTEIDDSTAGIIERDFDLLNRLTEETTPEGTVTYTYDTADRRATMTVAGQTQVSYGYDNADRLTSITQGTAAVGFTYDNADRRTVLTLANGVTIESAYDLSSQVTGLTYKLGGTTLGDLTYTYDLGGRRTAVGGSWARTGLPAALASATYNAANQISTWGASSFTYDNNGNLTNDGSKTYTWNARNQLAGLSGGASASFQYDGSGRRRAKTISGTSTGFVYDGVNAIQELSGGSPSSNILAGLGIDEWFARTDAATTRHFLTEPLGSTVALADGSGAVQTEYTYGAFGNTTATGASTTNRSGFTGREDDGVGLHHYRARYYDSVAQRFVSEDPIGFEGGVNLFAYVSNRPTAFTDPFGLKPGDGLGANAGRGAGEGSGAGGSGGAGGGGGAGRGGGGRGGGGGGGGRGDGGRGDGGDDRQQCPNFIDRWVDNFVNTNELPGIVAPSGLGTGLGAVQTIRDTMRYPMPRPVGVLSTPRLPPVWVKPLGTVAAAAAVGAAWETGVVVGAAIDAGFLHPCASF